MRCFAIIFVSTTTALTPATPHGKRAAPNMALRVERSVEGLFAAAPEPVAEPVKRGLFALFGR